MATPPIPCFFNDKQLSFKPRYEWAFGEKIDHPETTARAESILMALAADTERFAVVEPPSIPMAALKRQHSYELMTLYNTAAKDLGEDETFSPMVFPHPSLGRGDPTNLHQAGAFCFDSGTPLASQTLEAAMWSAACAHSAARALKERKILLSYALSRPPGHHATRRLFGGYCYFNNAALAARVLRRSGTVAVVDIDYHHGNGTQSLFYDNDAVLTVSIHGDPIDVFPYFAGYRDETGNGKGTGFNINIPQPHGVDGQAFFHLLDDQVLPALAMFRPDALVIAAGFDTYTLDPVGHFALETDDYHPVGERFGRLGLPTVVVQEGGYYAPHLGRNVVAFLRGVADGQRARGPLGYPRSGAVAAGSRLL